MLQASGQKRAACIGAVCGIVAYDDLWVTSTSAGCHFEGEEVKDGDGRMVEGK